MKLQEFKRLIREEVRKVLKENNAPRQGQRLSTDELVDYLSGDANYDFQNAILDYTINDASTFQRIKSRILTDANDVLNDHNIPWELSDVKYDVNKDVFTWTIA